MARDGPEQEAKISLLTFTIIIESISKSFYTRNSIIARW